MKNLTKDQRDAIDKMTVMVQFTEAVMRNCKAHQINATIWQSGDSLAPIFSEALSGRVIQPKKKPLPENVTVRALRAAAQGVVESCDDRIAKERPHTFRKGHRL